MRGGGLAAASVLAVPDVHGNRQVRALRDDDRTAAVGKWGPVFPVNWSGLFTDDDQQLAVGYYENPGADPASLVHPPVGWPYVVTHYDNVDFPAEDAPRAIYIASQLGSEGVGKDGRIQPVYDPAKFGNLTIYQQPDRKIGRAHV